MDVDIDDPETWFGRADEAWGDDPLVAHLLGVVGRQVQDGQENTDAGEERP